MVNIVERGYHKEKEDRDCDGEKEEEEVDDGGDFIDGEEEECDVEDLNEGEVKR